MVDAYPYYFAWGNNPVRSTMKGMACRVVARGKKNSICVEFESGLRHITSRNAVRKLKK